MKNVSSYIIPGIGLVLLILMYFIPLYYFEQLPEKIPKHFNSHGEVDHWTPKSLIYLLPLIATALYIFIELLGKIIPFILKRFDYLEEEQNDFLTLAILMLRTFNLLFMSVFFYTTLSIVMISLEKWSGISSNLTSTIFTAIIGIIVLFVYRFSKLKTE